MTSKCKNNKTGFERNKYIVTPICLLVGALLGILLLHWIGIGIPFIDFADKEINFTRFWGIFFLLISISYIIRIWLINKHPKLKASLSDKIFVIVILPYLFYEMLQGDSVTGNIIFFSCLATFSILLGFVLIYLSWKYVRK